MATVKGIRVIRLGTNSYTLTAPARTSAGVYNSEDVLVRTLWSVEDKEAGTHSIAGVWDGMDDNDTPT